MDLHKPKVAHSVREFLIEIGTITVGILIALSLEAAVEAFRNRTLVDRVRVDLRQELRSNRATLAREIAQDNAVAVPLNALVRYGRDRQIGKRPSIPPSLNIAMTFMPMSTAGWESAVATQALVHMPYEEAHALTRVYAGTRVFNEFENEASKHWIALNTLPDNPATMSGDELKSATRELAMNQAYQGSLSASGTHLLAIYDDAISVIK